MYVEELSFKLWTGNGEGSLGEFSAVSGNAKARQKQRHITLVERLNSSRNRYFMSQAKLA